MATSEFIRTREDALLVLKRVEPVYFFNNQAELQGMPTEALISQARGAADNHEKQRSQKVNTVLLVAVLVVLVLILVF